MKIDVVNLYSNIPDTGKPTRKFICKFSKDMVLECAKSILQINNMKFNNEFYNQIKGTAIGTIFAPT